MESLKIIFIFFLFPTMVLASHISKEGEKGENIFTERCSSCHTVGKGKSVGPDLRDVTKRRDKDWLREFILNPEKLFTKNDKVAMGLLDQFRGIRMPALGLTNEEISEVLKYIEEESGFAGGAQGQFHEGSPVPEGDSIRGREFFRGDIRFKNAGPPCITCHEAGGTGRFGGGRLGPALINAVSKFTEEGLTSVLKNISFPTMRPVYGNKPLTDEEISDIVAFLKASEGRSVAGFTKKIGFWSISAFVVFMIISAVFWRNRLSGVRRPLIGKN